MEIGEEGKPFIAEPLEDPFRRTEPKPRREDKPLPLPAPKEPAKQPERV